MDLEKIYNNDRPNAKQESLLAGILIELRKISKKLDENVQVQNENVQVQKIEPGPIEIKVEPIKKVAPKRKPANKKTTTKKKGK